MNEAQQYTIKGLRSSRHRILNNLPGTINFCPLISRTKKLDNYISENLSAKQDSYYTSVGKELMQRASVFLLLKDSKASFTIEKETPSTNRAIRWGNAIGQAGSKKLSIEEFERLQQIVIESDRFLPMGFRKEGGFVGTHDRSTGYPIPEHISARWQDVEKLINGVIETADIHKKSSLDAVLVAALIAFGFVYIHPFEDGNGRIHRYLIHHILAEKKFTQQGMIFPVSASILDKIDSYREVLESYSQPLLDFIKWKETEKHNVEVTNETIDFYRYFDATFMAEFLYDCVQDTVENIIPREIEYLGMYDEMKRYLDDHFEMPDRTVALLIRFLEQNNGILSNRARFREFNVLKPEEVMRIEKVYQEIFVKTEK